MRFSFFLITGLALSFAAPVAAHDCPFTYNDHVKYQIVQPAFVAAGETGTAFDIDNPDINEDADRIILLFHFRRRVMDAPGFRVELQPCTLKVLKAFRYGGMVAPRSR
jgi:hypothetical protein